MVYRCENCFTLNYSVGVLHCEVCGSDKLRIENLTLTHSESNLIEAPNFYLESHELQEEIQNSDFNRILSQHDVNKSVWNSFSFPPEGPRSSEYQSSHNVNTTGNFSPNITNYSLESTIPTEESSNQAIEVSNMLPLNDLKFFGDGSIVSYYNRNSQFPDTSSNSGQNINHSSFNPNNAGEANPNPAIDRIFNEIDKNTLHGNYFIFQPESSVGNEIQRSPYTENITNISPTLLWEHEELLQVCRQDIPEVNMLFPQIPNTWDNTHSVNLQYDDSGKHLRNLNLNFPHLIELLNQPSRTEPEIQRLNVEMDQIQRVIELPLADNQECAIDSASSSGTEIHTSQAVPENFIYPFSEKKMISTRDKLENSLTDILSREGNSNDDISEDFMSINGSPQQSERYPKQEKESKSVRNFPTLCGLLARSSAAPPLKKVYKCGNHTGQFSNKSLLDSHLKNQKENPHKCDQCPMEFRYKSGLLNHIPVHSDEKRLKCDYCGKPFKWKNNLIKHIKTFHGSH